MADQNSSLPPSPEDVAAGLDLSARATMEQTVPQSAEVAERSARFDDAMKAAVDKENYGWVSGKETVANDVFQNTIPGLAIQYLNQPAFKPDPAFTEQRYEERLKAAMQTLPEQYWDEFDSAKSDDHFDFLYSRAKEDFDRQSRLNDGWGPWAANVAGQFADPTNFVVGGGLFRGARLLGDALEIGNAGRRALNAGAGAAHALSYTAAQDALGTAPTEEDYLMATGLGLFFGGVVGPVSKNPALRSVAKGMAERGQQMMSKARTSFKSKQSAAAPAGPSAVSRAVDASEAIATPPKSVEVIADPPTPATPGSYVPAPAEPVTPGTPAAAGEPFNFRRQSLQSVLVKEGRESVDAILAKVPDDQLGDLMTAQRVSIDAATPPDKMRSAIADAVAERVKGRWSAATDTKRGQGASEVEAKFKGISSAADEAAAPKAAEAPKATRTADLEELEATPELTKNPRFVVAYRGGDGAEYRVLAQTADMSGPYKVMKYVDGKASVLAKDIDDIKQARAAIPRREIVDEAPAAPKEEPTHPADEEALPFDVDPHVLRERIDALQEQLHAAGDEETANAIKEAIRLYEEHAAPHVDEAIKNNSTTGAQATPAGVASRPEFLSNHEDWLQVRDDNVPKPALADVRIDRSGWLGKTRNAAARLVGNKLFNNTVGMADHSVAQRTTDLDMEQLARTYVLPYNQVRKSQFPVWARAMGYTRLNRALHEGEFAEHVATAIRNVEELPEHLPDEARQAVTRVADVARQVHKETLEDMKNPLRREGKTSAPLPEADRVADNDSYLWRRYAPERVRAFVEEHGVENLTNLFRGAIQRAQPDIEEAYLDRLARGFVRNLYERSYDIGDDWTVAMREGDRLRFARLLREDGDFTDQEIDHVMRVLWDNAPDPRSGFQHLKHRVLMDEYHPDAAGRRVVDLLDNDADRLITTYTRRVAGRVALARMQIFAPSRPRFRSVLERTADGRTISRQIPDGTEGGQLLVDGLRTDADIEQLMNIIKRWGATAENRAATGGGERLDGLADETRKNIDMLRFAIDRILARPDPKQQTGTAQAMRNIRDFHFMRLMWQGGFAQLGETGSMIGTLGTRAMFSQVPGFRRIIDAAGRSRLQSTIADEIESMGIGVERLHGIKLHTQEHYEDLPFTPQNNSLRERMTKWLSTGTKLTNEYSLMGFVTQMQERQAAAAVAQKLANIGDRLANGGKLGSGEIKRLAQLSLSEDSLQRVFANMRQHTRRVDGVFFKRKIAALNVDKWDLQTRAEFESALFKMTRKLVQAGDLGNTAWWMSSPTAQTFFQFRNFTFTAWQNATLYNAHIRDPQALISMLWSTAWSAAVRGAQVRLAASLMANGDDYEKRYGNISALARAGFQRSAYSSIIPMMIDTGLVMAGQNGMFDARNTAQPSDILGTPTATFASNLVQGFGGAVDSTFRGRQMSQAEIMALQKSLPGGTFLPFSALLSQWIKDRPRRAPRKHQLWDDE